MLLHVSIIPSSSGSILCSLLKLQFKTVSDLLRYINLVLLKFTINELLCNQLLSFFNYYINLMFKIFEVRVSKGYVGIICKYGWFSYIIYCAR